jgi:hypothetical protein
VPGLRPARFLEAFGSLPTAGTGGPPLLDLSKAGNVGEVTVDEGGLRRDWGISSLRFRLAFLGGLQTPR